MTDIYICSAQRVDQTCAGMAPRKHPWRIMFATERQGNADMWLSANQSREYRKVDAVTVLDTVDIMYLIDPEAHA